jgi:hypothetical protein
MVVMMHELQGFLERLTRAERTGGRVLHTGPSQLTLHDCMHWTHAFTEAVHARFPDVLIDVCACRGSLSGFRVVFTHAHVGEVRVAWYLAIALGLTACAYALVGTPWWWGATQWIQMI